MAENADSVPDPARLLLALMGLPFVQITTFEDKRHGTLYAVMMRADQNHWCHEVTDGLSPWHRTAEDAWTCFEANHPGVCEAIATVQAEQNADSSPSPDPFNPDLLTLIDRTIGDCDRALMLYDAASKADREKGIRPTSERSVARHNLGAVRSALNRIRKKVKESNDGSSPA